jgi:hypothetical protein
MKLLRRRVKVVVWFPWVPVGRLVLRVRPNDGRRLTADERLARAQRTFRAL